MFPIAYSINPETAGVHAHCLSGTALYKKIRQSKTDTCRSNYSGKAKSKLDLLQINRQHAEKLSKEQSELEARIESFELAYRMQQAAPEAVDLSSETQETKTLYGMNDDATKDFGKNCLLARRLVERGVRFVQLYHGCGSKWDAHQNIEANHTKNCKASDKPVAGLIKDLKRRGLLEDTQIWGGEFGRTPMSEKGTGRDHNAYGFTMFILEVESRVTSDWFDR